MDQASPITEAAHDHDAAIFWAIAVPAAAIALAICLGVVFWLVPATLPVETTRFLARTCARCKPEPREGIGYLTAIIAPIAVFWLVRSWSRLKWIGPSPLRLAAGVCWVFAVAIIGVLLDQEFNHEAYLGRRWLIGALACAVAWVTVRRCWRLEWPCQTHRGDLLSRIATPAAVITTALALLPALYRTHQPGILEVYDFHTGAQMDEFAAAVEGRTALVDFFPLYQNLLPYLLAPGFRLMGLSIGTFSIAMSMLSLACLLVVYRVFSALTGSPASGLGLYLPFLFASMMPLTDPHDDLHQQLNTFNYYAVGPLRYFGPYVLVAVLAWYLGRPGRVRLLVLFLCGGLVAINNLDFGLPALAGVLVAATFAHRPVPWRTFRHLARILATAVPGIGLAVVSFAVLSRFRSGTWPQLGMATFYQRAYAINGFQMLPMPASGLHWVIYVTMIGAIGRGLFDRRIEAAHRGLMLYGGVFGLGALMYFVGRSHHNVLITIFSAWALAFSILIWRLIPPSTGQIGPTRFFPAPLELLIVLGLLCSLVQARHLANPLEQLARLRSEGGHTWSQPESIIQFIQAHSRPGDQVIVSCHYGHVLALDAGVINVFPFSEPCAVVLKSQLDRVLAAIDQDRINKLFGSFDPEIENSLAARGFIQSIGVPGCSLWTNTSLACRSQR